MTSRRGRLRWFQSEILRRSPSRTSILNSINLVDLHAISFSEVCGVFRKAARDLGTLALIERKVDCIAQRHQSIRRSAGFLRRVAGRPTERVVEGSLGVVARQANGLHHPSRFLEEASRADYLVRHVLCAKGKLPPIDDHLLTLI